MQKRTKVCLSSAITIIGLTITIVVFILIYIPRNSYDTCQLFKAPYSLTFDARTDDILVTWYNPWPNEECGVTFTIEYAIDEGQINTVNTTEDSVILPRPTVCSSLSLEVWAVNEAGERSNTSLTRTYNEIPTDVDVTNIQLSPAAEGGLEVTWDRPADLENCNFEYRVVYSTDVRIDEIITTSEYTVIPDNEYCFTVWTSIYTYVSGRLVSLSLEGYENRDEVSDIEATQSLENINEMNVTWAKHSRHDACSLTYVVAYTGTTNEHRVETQDLTATLPAIFCINFVLKITAYSTISSTSNIPALKLVKLDPISLGPVQNLLVTTEDNDATISWTPPELAIACIDLEYNVTAINEYIQEEESCTGQFTCSLRLSSFCPETTFTIREISGIAQDDTTTHVCD